MSADTALIILALIALFASFVNGALGYGFSSLTVPLALVFYTNRILNPAIVLVEVFLNIYVLIINLKGVPTVWRLVFPIIVGLLPGIGIGALGLAATSHVSVTGELLGRWIDSQSGIVPVSSATEKSSM